MTHLTMHDRCCAYAQSAFGQKYPASQLHVVQEQGADVLYGTWVLGNDYRARSPLYGAYPPSYLDRVAVLFPDLVTGDVLHAFAGSLPPGPYVRLDLMRDEARDPDVVGDVIDAPTIFGARRFGLVLADPPYSAPDAKFYATPMVSRRKAISALASVVPPGGFLVWLDCVWPMHAKADWRTAGRIALVRCTNHRVRMISIFERQAA